MISPYETYNNQIGVRLSFIVKDDEIKVPESLNLITYSNYKVSCYRKEGMRLKEGKGKGNESLISWKYIERNEPTWKYALVQTFGNPVVEHNPMEEHFAIDETARNYFDGKKVNGEFLKPEQISQYTTNASVFAAFARLKTARETQHKRMGNSSRGLWPGLIADLAGFNEVLKVKFNGIQHTLPLSERRLRPYFKGVADLGYEFHIDQRGKQGNAKKVADEKHLAMLEALLRKHNNFNNEQVAMFYNIAATELKWKTIDATTVAKYREKLGLYVLSGNRGETNFRNTVSMQHKRTAPSVSMVYWTMDGWDAELLYQKDEVDKNGHKKTTYHNRLTVVIVLDPVAGIKYPIGYAIGTHESPALITEALRNAANHTAELFGSRHKTHQLQSDRYQIKALSPVYEAMSQHYTPARAKNAKGKVIEPYFLHLNRQAQVYFKNWSGFGVTANKDNQPNEDYLNKMRHSFPDEKGCREQITRLIQMERDNKITEYMERWEALPQDDRLPLTTGEYLYLFGQTHTHTNRLQGEGLTPTLLGETFAFDTFDTKFRELGYMDWAVKYDPSDLSQVLVMNAKCDGNRKLKEIIGTHRFVLEQKYVQPMALYDRKDGDSDALKRINHFNKQLEQSVLERMDKTQHLLDEVFSENPQLNDTLTKMVICDSDGQHKDQRNRERALPKSKKRIELPPSPPEDYEIIEDDIRNNY